MKKWAKAIIGVLIVLIVVVVLAAILLITLVNPNRFKPFIAEQVQKRMGRQLTIEGDLSWSFYPYLGIKVGHAELNNLAGFSQKNFAELESATVGVKVLPLLHRKFESSGMTITGLKVNLVKNAAGKANWEDFQKPARTQEPEAQKIVQDSNHSKPGFVIAITGIEVEQAQINLINEQTLQQLTIDKFDLNAKDLAFNRPFPVNMTFHFVNKGGISGRIALETKALLNIEGQLYQFKKTEFSAEIQQKGKNLKLITTTDINVDMKGKQADFQNWHGRFANVDWIGQLTIKNLTQQPIATGSMQLQPFALRDLMVALGDKSDLLRANNVKASVDFTFNGASKAASALQKLTITGLIHADDLLLKKFKMTDLMSKVQLTNGVFNLSPFSAVLYQGNLQGNLKADLNSASLPLTLNTKFVNVQAGPLLADVRTDHSSFKVKGTANVELQVTTSGLNEAAMRRNLNGNGKFSFNNGTLIGVDIPYWFNVANSLIKKQAPAGINSGETTFGTLTGTMTIHGGVISNNDLLLDMPLYTTSGKGTVDLIHERMNYTLSTKAKMDPESDKKDFLHIYGLTVPLLITGDLNHPKIALDTNELMKQVAKQQVEKVKAKVIDQIKDKIPGAGGELLQNLLGK
jgi:AsmA protein